MKKIILFLVFVSFSAQLQAKSVFDETNLFEVAAAVKIGRSGMSSTSSVSSVSGSTTEFLKSCQSSCKTCNRQTGECSECNSNDYYISNDSCVSCPSLYRCDGINKVGNCTGITCLTGYTPTADANGCCCK